MHAATSLIFFRELRDNSRNGILESILYWRLAD
jgi:hypothetical protein